MQDTKIQVVLAKLVAEHGLEVCKDVRKVKGLLSDHCGEKRREIRLLVMACEENIPQELLMLSETIPIEMIVKRLAKRMEDNWGTAEQAAQWTVGCWAAALGKLTPPQAEGLGKADWIAKPTSGQSSDDIYRIKLAEGIEMEFVRIPAGEFVMGRNVIAYAPPHEVYLDEYWMGKTPVTNQQYQCFIDANPQYQIPYSDGMREEKFNWDQKTRQHPMGRSKHPVVLVNWHDAQAFSQWAGCRLPTEAEWEKAAKGTDGREYPWGNSEPDKHLCNFNDHVGNTTEVGAYHPQGDSAYGCSDMAGNVLEWVSDWYDDDYYSRSPYANPAGPETGDTKVLRGGSWDDNYYLRTTVRDLHNPPFRYNHIGFRCGASPVP